jgi:NAD-dependent deacetylase
MRVIFLTGAGLSQESGVSPLDASGDSAATYRSIHVEYFERDPSPVHQVVNSLRTAARAGSPNLAHQALATYQQNHPATLLFTQNVDDLLERAGAPVVCHLHGCAEDGRCVTCGWKGRAPDAYPAPCICGGELRPDLVLFGEEAPQYLALERALSSSTASDALVVIGTGGRVIPVSEIAARFPGLTVLSNLHSSGYIDESAFDRVLPGLATRMVPQIIAELGH